MAETDRSANPLSEITFRCSYCSGTFKRAPDRIEDAPDQEWHPWRYFAACPMCARECKQVAWERALLKGWTRSTGPTSDAGKAKVQQNLAGHPTPEEALRTRFNAMKHGMSARTATYFPAKPDGYAFCKGCDVDRAYCAGQPCCVKQTQLFMVHHAAFSLKDPRILGEINADLQAALYAVLQQILQTIIADGVKVTQPQWYTDKDGRVCIAEYFDDQGNRRVLTEMEHHPLFRPLGELISRLGLSLADMGMTVRTVEEDQRAAGRLAHEAETTESLGVFMQHQAKSMEALKEMVLRSQARAGADPLLLEHQQEQGGA